MIEEDLLGRPQHRLLPRRRAELGKFSAAELASTDDVIEQLAGMTAAEVSELSHQEPGWRLTEVGETIPFATAFVDIRRSRQCCHDRPPSHDLGRIEQRLAEHWTWRSSAASPRTTRSSTTATASLRDN